MRDVQTNSKEVAECVRKLAEALAKDTPRPAEDFAMPLAKFAGTLRYEARLQAELNCTRPLGSLAAERVKR